MADSDSTSPDKKRQEPPPIEFLKPGEEQASQPQAQRPAAAWVTRPEDYQRPQYTQGPAPPRTGAQGTGNRPRLGGILLVLAGVTSLGYILYVSLTPPTPQQFQQMTNDTTLYALNQVCGTIVVWSQAVAVLSGALAYQRVSWRFTVGCAFYAMIALAGYVIASGDPLGLPAAILGVAGFALVAVSRREFLT